MFQSEQFPTSLSKLIANTADGLVITNSFLASEDQTYDVSGTAAACSFMDGPSRAYLMRS